MLEVMSTSVYTGLNPFNLYSQTLSADLLVRYFLCTQLFQFLIHKACVGDHDTLQPSAQRLSELPVLNGAHIRTFVFFTFFFCAFTAKIHEKHEQTVWHNP